MTAAWQSRLTGAPISSDLNQRRNTMSHHLDQGATDCISACNDCATECGNCFAHMVGKESKNDCPAAASSARRFAGCAPMRSPATARSSSRYASCVRAFATGVRNNATRMTWITASAAPRRVVVAPRLAARWQANQKPHGVPIARGIRNHSTTDSELEGGEAHSCIQTALAKLLLAREAT